MLERAVVECVKNPFMEYVEQQRRLVKEYYPLWDRGWGYFCRYIYARYRGRDGALRSVVERVELGLVPRTTKSLERGLPSEKPVVVASLVSYILLDSGVRSQGLNKLLRIYDARVLEFLKEYREGVAGLRSSVLSKALGSALSLHDELTHGTELCELFRLECIESSSVTATTFCIYSLFSLVLKDLRMRATANCSQYLEAMKKLKLESLTEEQLVMLLLTLGLLRKFYRNSCNDVLEPLAIRVYSRVQRFLSREVESHMDLSRSFWHRLSLALKLNNLDKVSYVPKEYVAIERSYLKELIANSKSTIESLAEALSEATNYRALKHREDVGKARIVVKQLEELLKKISEESSTRI